MALRVDTILDRLGGAAEVARLTGVGSEAIRKWRQSGAVPSKHWSVLMAAGGLDVADLSAAGAEPSRQPPREKGDGTVMHVPQGATAVLVLADGSLFWGAGFGARTGQDAADAARSIGELCFCTGMTGYQETLTDPSYAGQIITFTFPHIGNVGANGEDDEAVNVAARGLVVKQDLSEPSSWRAARSLDAWLRSRSIPGISGVDTRALTGRVRDGGPQTAVLSFPADGRFDLEALRRAAAEWPGLEGMDLARTVSCTQSYRWTEGTWSNGAAPGRPPAAERARKHVVAVDYGAKQNILRCLVEAGCEVTVVPATATAEEILRHRPDGVFLSNGPGDPAATADYAVPAIRGVLDAGAPVFGICLGHQLLALALGGRTYKLAMGHRGANQPVKDLETGRVEITSQNHGFAVDEAALPPDVRVTHRSLFDGSNEGLASTRLPAFSVQYHPEASPGPSDSFHLFERFVGLMDRHPRPRT